MMFSKLACSLLLLSSSHAVLYGDEQYGDIGDGRFWAFFANGVSIVNPETCSIEQTLKGDSLPSSWYDGIYMEYSNQDEDEAISRSGESHIRGLHSHPTQGYVLINSGVTSEQDPITGKVSSEILVFKTGSAEPFEVASRIEVGGRPVHSYGVHTRNEYWSHSDFDGKFYVVHLSDVTNHIGTTITKFDEEASHGKLLWSESSELGNRSFASSTGEAFLWEIDMETRSLTTKYDFSGDVQPGTCFGLHALAYSSTSQHVFGECVGPGGALEFDVSNNEIKFVHQWVDATGALYEVLDGSYVVASNKGADGFHIFKPTTTGSKHTLIADLSLPGNPSTPTFYPMNRGGDADYLACVPQVENPVEHQSYFCDNAGCSGAKTEEDVSHGICLYNPNDSSSLLTVSDSAEEATSIAANVAPYYTACNRCLDDQNFEDGVCTCTPSCGSCTNEPITYSSSNIGYYCMDLQQVIQSNGSDETAITHIKDTGAVLQSPGYSYGPACSYGRTYRPHKRGGKYDATVSNIPYDSVSIIDMSTQTKKCEVKLDGKPSRVIYVPSEPGMLDNDHDSESSDPTSSSGLVHMTTFMLMSLVSIVIGHLLI